MTDGFTVKADYSVEHGTCQVPPTWWEGNEHDKAAYVLLAAQGLSTCLEVREREGARSSKQVWVRPGVLGLRRNATEVPVEIREISVGEYNRNRVLRTDSGRLALLGLGIAILGLLIPLSIAGGESFGVLIEISERQEKQLLWLAGLLQLVGVVLVFYRGVWKREK